MDAIFSNFFNFYYYKGKEDEYFPQSFVVVHFDNFDF
jgi:hypothetical protein